MQINSISDFRRAFRSGPYAWPGGYALQYLCDDGGVLCHQCAKSERRNILEAIRDDPAYRTGWRVIDVDPYQGDEDEESPESCDHCGRLFRDI